MIAFIEFFVEEPSAEAFLSAVVPKIVPAIPFDVHAYQGVDDMLAKLPRRLRGYHAWLPDDHRIVVLRDEDRRDCRKVKRVIEAMATAAGLSVKRRGRAASFQVLTRVAVEELEAWLLGDVAALADAYPGVPPTLASQRAYRDADAIAGGTWEALERVLQRAGHFKGGLPKVQVAREVGQRMDPDRNTSQSFRTFRDGLRALG
jgi:hypothetical protein